MDINVVVLLIVLEWIDGVFLQPGLNRIKTSADKLTSKKTPTSSCDQKRNNVIHNLNLMLTTGILFVLISQHVIFMTQAQILSSHP